MGLRRKEEWKEDKKEGVERGSGEKKEERRGKERKDAKERDRHISLLDG